MPPVAANLGRQHKSPAPLKEGAPSTLSDCHTEFFLIGRSVYRNDGRQMMFTIVYPSLITRKVRVFERGERRHRRPGCLLEPFDTSSE
jgi:hypothetical protein